MTLLQAAVLGLVQGLAEFLPVSSSGHLVLARALFAERMPAPNLAFDVWLHLGTTAAVVVVFGRDLRPSLAALPLLLRPKSWRPAFASDRGFRLLILLGVSAVPAGLAGLKFHHDVDRLEETRPDLVALLLVVTGAWLAVASFVARRASRATADAAPGRGVGVREALGVGVAQAVAILPGISRSGATLGAGLLLGVRRDVLGPFAFLMSIAPILGAVVLKAPELAHADAVGAGALGVGVAVAFVAGVAALKLLLPFVRRGRLELFAVYCLLAGPLAYARLVHGG